MQTSGGFHELLGLELLDKDDGEANVVLDAEDRHLNAHGTVHGGAIATLVDTAMGAAVTATEGGERPVTIEMKVTYLEPGMPGRLIANACVRKRGKRITIVEAEVTQDGSDDLIAHAIATFATL